MATVLVVDDFADLRDLYRLLLSGDGHVVRTAESVEEALAVAQSTKPEIVMLGLGLASNVDRLVKALGPEVKVILTSGSGSTRDLPARAASLGVAYLLKPFSMDQLRAAIEVEVKGA